MATRPPPGHPEATLCDVSDCSRAAADPGDREFPQLPPRVVFYDGVCGVCDRAVRWIRARDPSARFHFAPLQGETAAALHRAFPDAFPADIETMAYVESLGTRPKIYLRSRAVFRILDEIGGGGRVLARLRVLPRWLTDLAYGAFVRIRYRVFGKLAACRVPGPDERAYFLP